MIINLFEHTERLVALRDSCDALSRSFEVLGAPTRLFSDYAYQRRVIHAVWRYGDFEGALNTTYDLDWHLYIEDYRKLFLGATKPIYARGDEEDFEEFDAFLQAFQHFDTWRRDVDPYKYSKEPFAPFGNS